MNGWWCACVRRVKTSPRQRQPDVSVISRTSVFACLSMSTSISSGTGEGRWVHYPSKPCMWLFMSSLVDNVIITFWSYQVCLDVGSLALGPVSILADNDASARLARLPSARLMRCCLSSQWLTDLLLEWPISIICVCVSVYLCESAWECKKISILNQI